MIVRVIQNAFQTKMWRSNLGKFRAVLIFVTEKVSVSKGFWLIGRRKVRLPLRPRGPIHPIFQFRQIVKFHDPPSRHGQKRLSVHGCKTI